MTTKIFVGRLAEGTTSEDIRVLFRKFGTVTECDVISNYGFVHMQTEAEANAAIAGLDGFSVKGSHISVEMSTTKTQGRKRRSNDTFSRGSNNAVSGGRYEPYSSQRDGYRESGPRPMGGGGRTLDRKPFAKEEYASEQVKDLLELYFRDRYAFDQYAKTYYYGERNERNMQPPYNTKLPYDYPIAGRRDDDMLARPSAPYSKSEYLNPSSRPLDPTTQPRFRYTDVAAGDAFMAGRPSATAGRDDRGLSMAQTSFSSFR